MGERLWYVVAWKKRNSMITGLWENIFMAISAWERLKKNVMLWDENQVVFIFLSDLLIFFLPNDNALLFFVQKRKSYFQGYLSTIARKGMETAGMKAARELAGFSPGPASALQVPSVLLLFAVPSAVRGSASSKPLPVPGPSEPPWPEVSVMTQPLQCQRLTISGPGNTLVQISRGEAMNGRAHLFPQVKACITSPSISGCPWIRCNQVDKVQSGVCRSTVSQDQGSLGPPLNQGMGVREFPLWGGMAGWSQW